MHAHRTRRAFTLVELLVVIAIIGMLQSTDVTDRTSSTLLGIVEIAGRPDYYESPGTHATPTMYQYRTKYAAWADPYSTIFIDGPTIGTRVINCDNDLDMYSFHPDGAVFPFADGSVHFLSQNIAPQTFYALFTPNQNEVINPEDY